MLCPNVPEIDGKLLARAWRIASPSNAIGAWHPHVMRTVLLMAELEREGGTELVMRYLASCARMAIELRDPAERLRDLRVELTAR